MKDTSKPYSLDDLTSLPKWVTFENGTCALRLVIPKNKKVKPYYHREAGLWGVEFVIKDNKIVIQDENPMADHLVGKILIETSEEFWMQDNGLKKKTKVTTETYYCSVDDPDEEEDVRELDDESDDIPY